MTIIPSGSDAACGLAQEPLRAISFYGAADFAASHNTDANSIGRFSGMEKHDRVTGNELLSGIVAATKLPSVRQGSQASPLRVRPAAVWARLILRAHGRSPLRSLRGQPLAAFGTASLQNETATTRAHALAETVLAFAFDIARLKCALHDRES